MNWPSKSEAESKVQRTLFMIARILDIRIPVYFIFSDLMGQSTVSKDARNKAREREGNRMKRGNKDEW